MPHSGTAINTSDFDSEDSGFESQWGNYYIIWSQSSCGSSFPLLTGRLWVRTPLGPQKSVGRSDWEQNYQNANEVLVEGYLISNQRVAGSNPVIRQIVVFIIFRYSYKKHSEDAKNKISESKKKNMGKGQNNSQYGTCWITNDIENKK